MHIVIGGAWPYANGSLHIGHIAGLLPGDVLARFYRQDGNTVSYVSGSDCHGTPITLHARKTNKTPQEVSDYYHAEFCECFQKLGFSYDYYGKTSSKDHKAFIKSFHASLYQSESVVEKTAKQAFCRACQQFLPDRFVNGECPYCHKESRGDQCEHCGAVFDSVELIDPACAECGQPVEQKPSKHLYLKLSDFAEAIMGNINAGRWRKNAVDFTERYIREGLRDRALSRDIDWGIDVPKEGYEDKKIYIWAENVLGYLSSSHLQCRLNGVSFSDFWHNKDALHYYVHGKDNIPFHSIILPALLLAEGSGYHLPDAIISSEYMTLNGRKISTSNNHAIWVNDLLAKYDPDAIRFFFLFNAPEKRDADFSFREFIHCNNSELLGVYGNFVNRTLIFIEKYFDHTVPEGQPDTTIHEMIERLYTDTASQIETGSLKDALCSIMAFARFANKYYDREQPWVTRNTDRECCKNTIFNCVQIIANLCVLLEPFIPFSSRKVYGWLGITNDWATKHVLAGVKIPKTEILFPRIDKQGCEK